MEEDGQKEVLAMGEEEVGEEGEKEGMVEGRREEGTERDCNRKS